ncbi:acetylornithine deacetylase [Citrobacter amalonaticus]|uniref:Acetylornithine deacetylase n=1 Tax=Citrobacter amalonaticus TaxID=35703 RepID=A0A2S4S3Q3_CITAM|nr:M20 family metallopeptidase [Citrobacter amalonaticus]POT59897.1 acetylornithine deacetylase [Citrobacter amalonaticus]POT78028.1 acetylornithine deacetylase [Citrobacter amalonaticus]POU68480.1 acetylornithine deacetylase [Citrobacter amalonaticus]POV08083.1 acetylornithine deacetylase [Citrobacter amalonaticus]
MSDIELTADDRQELLTLLCSLIQHPSENPPGNENAVALFIASILRSEGIETEIEEVAPGRPNVIAHLKGIQPGKRLILNGHTDVVPCGDGWSVDPFAAVIDGDCVIGRGAADMKSGVAAMIYAAILIKRRQYAFKGEITLLFNVDEERINLGMEHFVAQGVEADFAIIGEPTSLEICVAHKGVSRTRLTTHGTAGHAAKTRNPDSAIDKMALLLPKLLEECLRVKQKYHPLLGNASMLVTTINGGSAPNIVPQSCSIEIDRRVLPGELRNEINSSLQDALMVDGLSMEQDYSLDNYLFIPASSIEESHPLTETACRVVNAITGNAKKTIFDATCEAPFFSVGCQIPTIILGPGDLSQAHVKDEFVRIEELHQAAKIYISLALNLLK